MTVRTKAENVLSNTQNKLREAEKLLVLLKTHEAPRERLLQIRFIDIRLTDRMMEQMSTYLQSESCVVERLILRNNELGPKDAVELSDVLERNASIKIWSLQNNSIGGHGASCMTKSLLKNKRHCLTEVNLSSCDIGNEGARSWARAIPQLAKRKLKKLILSSNGITDVGAEEIANQIDNNVLKRFYMDLRRNSIQDKGAKHLMDCMGRNRALVEVLLEGNEFSPTDTYKILGSLDMLSRKNKAFSDQREFHASLEDLCRRDCLMEHCEYRSIDMNCENYEKLSEALEQNASIKSLSLGNNGLPSDGAVKIFRSILKHKALNILRIEDNNIDGEALEKIGQELPSAKKLRMLSFSNVLAISPESCQQRIFSRKAASLWHRAFVQNETLLTHLELGNNCIDDIAAGVLLHAFGWRPTLRYLDLKNNLMSDTVKECMRRMLRRNYNLEYLNLGILPLAKELRSAREFSNLSSLIAGRFEVFDDTIRDIVDCAKESTSLTSLEISAKYGSLKWDPIFKELKHNLDLNVSSYSKRTSAIELQSKRKAHKIKCAHLAAKNFTLNLLSKALQCFFESFLMQSEDKDT